jgi:translocation and assembly module TamB
VSRRRIQFLLAGVLMALALAGAAGVAILRSAWFKQKIREGIIAAIDEATGGRAEVADFRFDWRSLRVEIYGFVLHGTEPAGKPALAQAAFIAAGLKIVSLARREVDLDDLEVKAPRIYLIVNPDGSTNLPEPKVKHKGRSPLEALVNLAIARFQIESGMFEVESRGRVPFDASGRNLRAQFRYEQAGRKYRGDIAILPLELTWNGRRIPFDVDMALALEPNRIAIKSARWAAGPSQVSFSGAIEDLVSPRASIRYQAHVSLPGLKPVVSLPGIQRGIVHAAGEAFYRGPNDYSATGDWQAAGVDFRQDLLDVVNFRARGKFRVDAKGGDLSAIRLAAEPAYNGNRQPVGGEVASVVLRGHNIAVRGIALNLLGGAFEGEASLEAGSRFRVGGEIRGVEAKRAVAVYNPREPLPWNSLLSGPVAVEGSLPHANDLRVSTKLVLGPAPSETPVWGELSATFDARADTLDLGTSVVNLPSSRLVVSGSIGRQLRAHLETRDLNDLLPVLGRSAAALPLKLEKGSLVFDGSVTSKLESPQVAGRVNLSRFSWSGECVDSFEGTVNLSSTSVRVQNAAMVRDSIRAQFDATLGLHNWQADDRSSIAAQGAIHNAPVGELLARLGHKELSASGTLSATAQVSGTLGAPQAAGEIEITKGRLASEPFDRLAAHLTYDAHKLQAGSGQITAGPKRAAFDVAFDHAPGSLNTGRIRFQIETNSMPLDRIESVEKARPGLKGSVQISANGAADLAHGDLRIAAIDADVTARGVQLAGKPLGDAHLTAKSEGPLVRANIDSTIANSMVKGQGELRLEGDYPGTANLRFSRLDLADLRNWIAPAGKETAPPFQGFAEGEVRLEGPARKPHQMRAVLRIESLELGRPPAAGLPPDRAGTAAPFVLRNAGPIVANATNAVVTIESARLTGPSTDLTVGGRVLLNLKSPLDLRANGKVDLSVLRTLSSDLTCSGTADLEATVRGALGSPQITGRVEIQNAAASIVGFPNGVSNLSGIAVFAGDHATIQSLTGETGGGQIRLSGFAGYSAGQPVFRLNAETKAVRLRYPEGISTVSNADLTFTGTAERSTLAGTVSVLRGSLNVESDFSSLLAKSAEPVRTPSANTGFLGGMNFDVQVQTAPDAEIESSLTQGVQADANLRLRGTATNPALQGRVNITQGQVLFFGTKYVINQGSISFFNPLKVEPVLDIDLDTRVRGIDVTLTVAGPLNKLTLTPRSDPPLQFNEIVSLLTTGSSPTTDTGLRVQQSALPQPAQQTAASALLGQVIASPVTGRLQRFFGLSGIRIDPTLPGIEYGAQARLTLQQQVTPDVTFTYITNVAQANPQVVSVEWAVNKQWSVVAQREENGLVGLDFFYKKRFK